MRKLRNPIARKVCGALAFLSFLVMYGTAGGIERDRIGLASGFLLCLLFLALAALFTYLAGGFYGQEDDEQGGENDVP